MCLVARVVVITALLAQVRPYCNKKFVSHTISSTKIAFLNETSNDYRMSLFSNDTVVHLEGNLSLGVSRDFAQMLAAHPNIHTVIIDSSGGIVYEARELAKLIMDRNLDTCTSERCSSVATIAFIAGKKRMVCGDMWAEIERLVGCQPSRRGAYLGFCKYKDCGGRAELEKIEQKDLEFFASRGVDEKFLDKLSVSEPNDLWIPSNLDLYNSGVITLVVKLSDLIPKEELLTFGYDSTHKTINRDDDAYIEHAKTWILACSGVLWEYNGDEFNSLAGMEINRRNISSREKLLSKWWNTENRDALLYELNWLTQGGGDRKRFNSDVAKVSHLSWKEFDSFLGNNSLSSYRHHQYCVAYDNRNLGERSILAFDLSRFICLCRWGYMCGYLDEKTAWEYMIPVARKIQSSFSSWSDFGSNYLIGRRYWSTRNCYILEHSDFEEALLRFVGMPSSPTRKIPWNLDLSYAYDIIPDAASKREKIAKSPKDATESKPQEWKRIGTVDLPKITAITFTKENAISQYKEASHVLIVPDDYKTIQAAIDASGNGDTIFIKNGIYDGNLLIKDKTNIKIVGQSTLNVVVNPTSSDSGDALTILDSSDILISDMTIKNQIRTDGSENHALMITNSNAKILRCSVSNSQGVGIGCYDSADVSIAESLVDSCLSSGVSVKGGSTKASITLSNLIDNKYNLAVDEGGYASMSDSIAAGSKKYGIFVRGENSKAELSNVRCNKSGEFGICLAKKANATISGCTIDENSSDGIIVELESTALIKDSLLYKNAQSGITLYGKNVQATLQNNICRENLVAGILVSEYAKATIESNYCYKNTRSGIMVFGKENFATLKANQCIKNIQNGIYVSGSASADMKNNICAKNRLSGIKVADKGSSAVVEANHCIKNTRIGIFVTRAASAELKNNTCKENKYSGIIVSGKKTSATLVANLCDNNADYGIMVKDYAKALVENSRCKDNLVSGICVLNNGTQADLVNNYCSGNRCNGIIISGCYKPKVSLRANTCETNYPSGILITRKSSAVLNENICRKNLWAGIVIANQDSHATLIDNHFDQNGGWGIHTYSGVNLHLENNTTKANALGKVKYNTALAVR